MNFQSFKTKTVLVLAGLLVSSAASAVSYTYRVPAKGVGTSALAGSGGSGASTPSGPPSIVDISAGYYSAIALDSNGGLWTTGTYLGDGTGGTRKTFQKVPIAGRFTAVSAGYYHMLALKDDGTLWGAGYQQNSELGMPGDTFNSFTQIPGVSNVKSIVAGNLASYFVKTDGTIWGVGAYSSACGCSTFTQLAMPAGKQFEKVTSKERTLIATATDGSVWAFGYNEYGHGGLGNYNQWVYNLTQTGASGVYAMAQAGLNNTAAVRQDGTLWVTGLNSSSSFGFSSPSMVNVFTQTGAGATYVSVHPIQNAIMALTVTGAVWASGKNLNGTFGSGTNTARTTFGQTAAGPFTKLSAGWFTAFAMKADGTVWAAGSNYNGEAGLGDAVPQANSFTQVTFAN